MRIVSPKQPAAIVTPSPGHFDPLDRLMKGWIADTVAVGANSAFSRRHTLRSNQEPWTARIRCLLS